MPCGVRDYTPQTPGPINKYHPGGLSEGRNGMPSLEVSAFFGGHPLSSEGTGYAPKRHCGAKFFTACFFAKQAVSFVTKGAGQISEGSPDRRFLGTCKLLCHNVAASRSPRLQSYLGYIANHTPTLNGLCSSPDATHSGLVLFSCRYPR